MSKCNLQRPFIGRGDGRAFILLTKQLASFDNAPREKSDMKSIDLHIYIPLDNAPPWLTWLFTELPPELFVTRHRWGNLLTDHTRKELITFVQLPFPRGTSRGPVSQTEVAKGRVAFLSMSMTVVHVSLLFFLHLSPRRFFHRKIRNSKSRRATSHRLKWNRSERNSPYYSIQPLSRRFTCGTTFNISADILLRDGGYFIAHR